MSPYFSTSQPRTQFYFIGSDATSIGYICQYLYTKQGELCPPAIFS